MKNSNSKIVAKDQQKEEKSWGTWPLIIFILVFMIGAIILKLFLK